MAYVIATNRNWQPLMVENISRHVGEQCIEINRQEELSTSTLAELNPDIIFFPFWSDYIPQEIYENYECIVFHMTDLPFGRGGSPLQNLIKRGIKETKISALRCTAELDAGPVYLKKPLKLEGRAQDIYMNAAEIIKQMIIEIITHKPEAGAQQGDVVEFKRRVPADSDIRSLSDLNEIYDSIRMVDADGYPLAYVEVGNMKIEFHHAKKNDSCITAEVIIKVNNNE